jgi:hypothetical protein
MSKARKLPDATQFDPLKLAYWDLPMALSWIIWRTPEAVRSQWELYDFHFRDLNRTAEGSLPQSNLRSLHDLLLSTEDDEVDQSAVLVKGPAARDDLWNKLGSAQLTATGIGVQSGKREPIACTEWQDLDSFDPGLCWPFDAVGKGHKHELKFKKVSVSSKDVLDLWPIGGNKSASGPDKGGRPPEYDWPAIEEYALGLVKQRGAPGRDNRRLPSKSQLVEAVLNEWASRDITLSEPTVRKRVGIWLKKL